MKHFIVTVSRSPKEHSKGFVLFYENVDNVPIYKGRYNFQFESDNQAVRNGAKELQLLDPALFEKSWNPTRMREEKIVEFHWL